MQIYRFKVDTLPPKNYSNMEAEQDEQWINPGWFGYIGEI